MPLKITEQVQVLVEHTDPDGTTFRDAIYLTKQQRAVLTDADLVVIGNARVTTWKANVETMKNAKPVELTEEQKQAQVDDLLNQQAQLDVALAQVDPVVLEARKEALGIEPVELSPVEVKGGDLIGG
jgi:precorrin-6B methylase 1